MAIATPPAQRQAITSNPFGLIDAADAYAAKIAKEIERQKTSYD
ncbi:MAG: hypothetical protein WCC90_14525 [Methylocella sp.]